jgi:hypothetical protein
MGDQRARQRKYFLFCLACCIISSIGLGGCLYYPEKWKSEEHLALSKYYLQKGNFKASLKESQTALELFPRLLGDQALFQIGLVHAHPDNPDQNLQNSKAAFQRLLKDYPNSNLRTQAELWIIQFRRAQALETELNNKKQEIGKLQDRMKKNQAQNKKLQKEYIQKIKTHEKEIRELKNNIKRLKEIDLKIDEKKRKTIP